MKKIYLVANQIICFNNKKKKSTVEFWPPQQSKKAIKIDIKFLTLNCQLWPNLQIVVVDETQHYLFGYHNLLSYKLQKIFFFAMIKIDISKLGGL